MLQVLKCRGTHARNVLRQERLLRSVDLLPRLLRLRLLLMAEKTVLFVCVENAGRSLMAEAAFNANPPPGWHALSGGTRPAAHPNPRTAVMLREVGLELPGHAPQIATPEMIDGSTVRITMGCLDDEACPANLKTLKMVDWALPDPSVLDDAGARKVRDQIIERVRGLRTELVLRDRRMRPGTTPAQ